MNTNWWVGNDAISGQRKFPFWGYSEWHQRTTTPLAIALPSFYGGNGGGNFHPARAVFQNCPNNVEHLTGFCSTALEDRTVGALSQLHVSMSARCLVGQSLLVTKTVSLDCGWH